jgi:hypothetical protein
VFVVDDLLGWLIGRLAGAGYQGLGTLVRGSDQVGALPARIREAPLPWLSWSSPRWSSRSIVAAAGSVGAVWYSRRSAKSAAVSAAAASATAALDSQRRHEELTPGVRHQHHRGRERRWRSRRDAGGADRPGRAGQVG